MTVRPTVARRNIYVALEDIDFVWDEKQLNTAIAMWNECVPIQTMAKELKRSTDEVALLVMDLARHGRIKSRIGGVFGNIFH